MAAIKVDRELSKWLEIKHGARQRCVMSPDLFSSYSERVLGEVVNMKGIKEGGKINNIGYADDTLLIANLEEKLQEIVNKVEEAERKGLKINARKTGEDGNIKKVRKETV